MVSDFRVMADQGGLFGPVASVPTLWRTLSEIAAGGPWARRRISAAVNAARRRAWRQIEDRHGAVPGVAIADKVVNGVICIRMDAAVLACHSDKQGGPGRIRTCGTRFRKPLLYPLSYEASTLARAYRSRHPFRVPGDHYPHIALARLQSAQVPVSRLSQGTRVRTRRRRPCRAQRGPETDR